MPCLIIAKKISRVLFKMNVFSRRRPRTSRIQASIHEIIPLRRKVSCMEAQRRQQRKPISAIQSSEWNQSPRLNTAAARLNGSRPHREIAAKKRCINVPSETGCALVWRGHTSRHIDLRVSFLALTLCLLAKRSNENVERNSTRTCLQNDSKTLWFLLFTSMPSEFIHSAFDSIIIVEFGSDKRQKK